MRLLFIICEANVDGRVIEMLTQAGAPGYTRFTNGTGRGKNGIREGTPVWPGLNSLILAAAPEALVPVILDGIERLQEHRSGRLAVKVFSVPTDEYL